MISAIDTNSNAYQSGELTGFILLFLIVVVVVAVVVKANRRSQKEPANQLNQWQQTQKPDSDSQLPTQD